MLQAIDISRAGMLRQAQWLDATSNNIANDSTTGYKATRAELETGEDSVAASPALATGTATPGLSGQVRLSKLFTQGPVAATGNPTDLAITGEGFFQVQNPDGSPGYTRAGALNFDSARQLTDGNGRTVQPPVTLPAGASDIQIARDGTVTAQQSNGTRAGIGQLQLARFTNPNGLLAGADGVYVATAASGPAINGTPGAAGFGSVQSGALEGSNSDLVGQMAAMIAAQRGYELNASAFRLADQMLSISSTLPGSA